MNVYFACSITGGREFEAVYQAIVAALVEKGHEVPTAHLAESGATSEEAVISPVRYMRVTWHGCVSATRWWRRSASRRMGWGMRFCAGCRKTRPGFAPGEAQGFEDDQRQPRSQPAGGTV
jgi:hypothetical protein